MPNLGTVIRLVVGLGLPVLLVVRLGAGGVVEALAGISGPVVAAALLLGALTTVAGAARWCVVARGVGLSLPLGEATADAYRATLLNSLLPAGVLGDVHRAVRHHRPGDGRGAVRADRERHRPQRDPAQGRLQEAAGRESFAQPWVRIRRPECRL